MEGVVVRSRFRIHVFLVRLKWIVVQTVTAITLIFFLLWMSVFLYGTFYYMYMPVVSHEWPVHLRFRSDCDTDNRLCSFPTANLSLMSSSQKPVLVHGQAYVVKLEMEMPESAVNQNLGMFMVQIQFYTRQGEIVFTSARSAMLQYKSFIHRTVETVFFLPSLVFRSFSQKQLVSTELSDSYFEDPYHPAVGAVVQVQSKKVEIYNISLKIHARFSGVRYLLFYWPTLSAIVGISSNFFFLSIVTLFSWLAFLAKSSGDLQTRTEPEKPSSSESSVDNDKNATKDLTNNAEKRSGSSPKILSESGVESLYESFDSVSSDKLLSTSPSDTIRKRKL